MRWIIGLLLLLVMVTTISAQDATETPDVFATATAFIEGATATEAARQARPTRTPTIDTYPLTATQLIVQATQTAVASGVAQANGGSGDDGFLRGIGIGVVIGIVILVAFGLYSRSQREKRKRKNN